MEDRSRSTLHLFHLTQRKATTSLMAFLKVSSYRIILASCISFFFFLLLLTVLLDDCDKLGQYSYVPSTSPNTTSDNHNITLGGNIRNCYKDALYFTITTWTTVGFGDLYPTESYGKFLVSAMALSEVLFASPLCGMLFGVITAKLLKNLPWLNLWWRQFLMVIIFLLANLIFGTVVFSSCEGVKWWEGSYASAVALSSIGLGDRPFSTCRVWGAVFVFISNISRCFICAVMTALLSDPKNGGTRQSNRQEGEGSRQSNRQEGDGTRAKKSTRKRNNTM